MNLNDLKPAWRQFLLFNSMQPIDQKEILSILERADGRTTRRSAGFLLSTMLFIIVSCCCQGG